MGEKSDTQPQAQPPSIPQLEDSLWKLVTEGKIKGLLQYVTDHSGHAHFKKVLNNPNSEFDEDGGNIVIHCVKEGRDKGSTFSKDHGACLVLLCESGANVDGFDKARRTALSWAVSLRYPNYVSKLLKVGAKVDCLDQDGATPWHIALQCGRKDVILAFLEHHPQIVHNRDGKGVPPLVIAVKYGHMDICRLLLEKGANVNDAEQKTRRTPVYHAIRNKHIEVLDILLKYQPKLDTIDSEGRTLLYLCCESKDIRFFQRITSQCPRFSQKIMDSRADDDKTAVIVACQHGNGEQLKHLLEAGASVEATDVAGKTALHYCADNLETQCAEMLLEKTSSILEVKDEQGYTAMALSVLVGNINLLKLLLEKGADIDTQDNEGHKLAHWAAVTGHLKVLDLLIQHKADMSTADNHHAYPIHYAAQMNSANSGNPDSKISEKVLKKVIDCKVKLDVVDDAGRPPLLWAACSGNAESCKLLLKSGADINSRDKDDLTAFHCAASRGHYQCIEVLRKQGANCNLMDKNRCTPLFYAITLGNKDCTKALINAKADVNHVDDRGRNPAHCSAIKGSLETMKMLEKEKADLWHQNNKGDYPIHEAAQKGHLDVVKYLLRQRNDVEAVNVTNKAGKTLLHIAAATNNLPLCKLLINYDCDKNAFMKHAGKEFTPYDLAVIKGYQETADYLKTKGALSYSDLTNVEKRESKSARARRESKIETVPEEAESTNVAKNTKKSPAKTKTPSPEKGKNSPKKAVKSPEKLDKSATDDKAAKAGAADTAVATAAASDKTVKDSEKEKEQNKNNNKEKNKDKSKSDSDIVTAKAEVQTEKNKTEKSETDGPVKKATKSVSPDSKKTSTPIPPVKASPKKSESPTSKKSESLKLDKSVGIDKSTTGVNTEKEEPKEEKTENSKGEQLKKKPSADSVLDKEDGIRTSNVSLRSEESPLSPPSKNVGTQKNAVREVDRATSAGLPMGQSQGKKKKETGKYVSLEKIEHPESKESNQELQKRGGRKSRVGFEKGRNKSDNEDSGNETDPSRPRQKRIKKKPYLNTVRDSVKKYQDTRNNSRSMQQLKRAQIHTGPMHDIVMFSKMMDNYRRGLAPEDEEEIDIRTYANWDGYLNDQLRFVSHLYNDDSKSPRDIQETAKETHDMLQTEANNRKQDTDKHCAHILDYEEKQRKKNVDMDKEIDHLVTRTAEMFDNIKTGAASSLNSAKSRNEKLREEMRKSREEKIQMTEDPSERDWLERQQMEEDYEYQQSELERERKERSRQWHRRKDEEMRRRLLQAYRPYFPNDVFTNKSVCLTGGRIKSAGRLRIEGTPSPRPKRSHPSPRPGSHSNKSDSNYSVAQYKLKEDKTQVQMTPYGLRRVRNQERPTYEEVEDELADAIFFNNTSRCTRSADAAANWSRKYDGSIRPRTGLVFVEPRVYDNLIQEEKDAKRRISSEVRHQYTNGDSRTPSNQRLHSANTSDSILS